MKGTELSDRQLLAAEKFLRLPSMNMAEQPRDLDRQIILPWGDLIRIVAWYGQIRAQAVADGVPPNEPGETYIVGNEAHRQRAGTRAGQARSHRVVENGEPCEDYCS